MLVNSEASPVPSEAVNRKPRRFVGQQVFFRRFDRGCKRFRYRPLDKLYCLQVPASILDDESLKEAISVLPVNYNF